MKGSADDAEDFVFAKHHVLDAVELQFGTGVLSDQNLVASLHGELADFAVIQGLAGAYGHDFGLGRLFLGAIGDYDAARRGLLFIKALFAPTSPVRRVSTMLLIKSKLNFLKARYTC